MRKLSYSGIFNEVMSCESYHISPLPNWCILSCCSRRNTWHIGYHRHCYVIEFTMRMYLSMFFCELCLTFHRNPCATETGSVYNEADPKEMPIQITYSLKYTVYVWGCPQKCIFINTFDIKLKLIIVLDSQDFKNHLPKMISL